MLSATDNIFDFTQTDEKLVLTSEQVEMLMMSEQDIEHDNLISENDLKESDSEWMS